MRLRTFLRACAAGAVLASYALTVSSASALTMRSLETRLTFSGGQWSPSVYGNKVVYADSRNGNADIYLYDLATGVERRITTNTRDQREPSIWGNKIVYMDDRQSGDQVYCYDLATKQETRLTDYPNIYAYYLSSDKVVYLYDDDAGDSGTRVYNLTDATDIEWMHGRLPEFYGNRAVYSDYRNENYDIYLYDLTADTETTLTTDPATQEDPSIYGDNVVYEDWRNGNKDIYCYNLATKTERRLTYSTAYQEYPIVRGPRVVYEDVRNGNRDIYYYNLDTGYEMRLTNSNYDQSSPAISGNKLVYYDLRNGNHLDGDIYCYDFSYLRLGTPHAPSTARHTRPVTVWGSVIPRHKSGTYPVRIYRWKKTSSGRWKSYGYVSAKVYNYSYYSHYKASVRLKYAGLWRLRTYAPADGDHAARWSGHYDYVCVR